MTLTFDEVCVIYKKFQQIERKFPQNSKRKNFFLAACLDFDPNVNLQTASKLRPYGGLIGINNSSWEDRLKDSKILLLHAVLHDAAGFFHDLSQMGPGYIYALPCPINSCYLGHASGIFFCYLLKLNRVDTFSLREC